MVKSYHLQHSLKKLNDYGNKHGIGRVDIVENRYVGYGKLEVVMKLQVEQLC